MRIRVVLAVLVVAPALGCGGNVSFTVPKEKMQASLDECFPLNSGDLLEQKLPVQVTLRDPEILLTEGSDRFGLKVKVHSSSNGAASIPKAKIPAAKQTKESSSGSGFPKPPGAPSPPFRPAPPQVEKGPIDQLAKDIDGSITLSGEISFEPEESKFFLLHLTIDDVDLAELPDQLGEVVQKAAEKMLNSYLSKNAVYTLSAEDTQTKVAKRLLKSVSVKDGELTVVLGP